MTTVMFYRRNGHPVMASDSRSTILDWDNDGNQVVSYSTVKTKVFNYGDNLIGVAGHGRLITEFLHWYDYSVENKNFKSKKSDYNKNVLRDYYCKTKRLLAFEALVYNQETNILREFSLEIPSWFFSFSYEYRQVQRFDDPQGAFFIGSGQPVAQQIFHIMESKKFSHFCDHYYNFDELTNEQICQIVIKSTAERDTYTDDNVKIRTLKENFNSLLPY